jgi:dihydrofolate synthase / folylpolyglutamate synthase
LRSLEEWLAHQERVHPQSIDLGLERLEAVLGRLGWSQPRMPVITIAGTNGKGSVAAYASAILQAAGYRVGTFTSPHLRDYRERIRVQNEKVEASALVAAFERIEEACGATSQDLRPPISLTFFEYNALAAFLVFESARLDAWVLEVGMGGRLDAVNVIDASVAVVVSIGLDHQEFLGTTIEAIAREKAGIFRSGAPAVLGSRHMPDALEACARSLGAPLKRLGREFGFSRQAERWRYRGTRWDLPDLPPPGLVGDTQYANASTAIAALEELTAKYEVSARAVAEGIAAVRLEGRFQMIEAGGVEWFLDVAHNPDAARVLAMNLEARPIAGRTLAVCGILADKDAGGVAMELAARIDEWWMATTPGARGTGDAVLVALMEPHLKVPIHRGGTIGDACAAALAAARAGDRIIVFGSFHTVAPALDWLEQRESLPGATLREYTVAPRIP